MSHKSITFIDARVSNLPSLGTDSTVFVLDAQSDGLAQMAAYLQGQSGLDAIHVISHGSAGALYLGNTVLNQQNLAGYAAPLRAIGASLSAVGDLLLYGCNVAQGAAGLQFINALAQATGADVAASDDATGAAALGGDGVLERAVGQVATPVLAVDGWAQTLAVNTAPTFTMKTGKVTTDFGLNGDEGHSVIVQADGKILVAGYSTSYNTSTSDFALARYNANGSLDTSFDGDGKLTTDFFGLSQEGWSITLQADGKILVAGSAYNSSSGWDFALARYNANGSLDTSFDGDGKLTTVFFGSEDFGKSITLQADGKVLVAGSASNGSSGYDFALARYNADGSLDTSFNGDGKLVTDFFGSHDGVESITLQADGKILVAGYAYNASSSYDFALARYNADGSLDTSFDDDGKLTTSIGLGSEYGRSVSIQADGKIVVTGYSGSIMSSGGYIETLVLVRYNSNGSLDTNFDGDGKLITPIGEEGSLGSSVTVQSDGKILVAGTSSSYINNADRTSDFALVRYNDNGSLDTSFDGDGKVAFTLSNNSGDYAYDLTVQADGKILLAGSSDGDFALARLNGDGGLDTSFGIAGNTLDHRPSFTEQQHYGLNPVTLDPDVQILDPELAATGNYNSATLTLQRHGAASAQDVFSAASSALTVLTPGSYFSIDGTTIGRVTTNSAGTLTLTFNTNATQSLVNKAMQHIAYANTSDAPPASVQIDWIFSDGNSGAQGTGGALSVTGSTTVQITATNDAPVLSHALSNQNLTVNTAFSYIFAADAFTDPDLETLSYSVKMADGTGVPPWLSFNPATRTFSGTPGAADTGDLDIVVTATDSANTSASDTVRLSAYANALPSLSIAASNATQTEGQSGTKPFTFTVTRSGDATGAVSATWDVAGSGANAATTGYGDDGSTVDVIRPYSGTVSFAAGQTSATVTLEVIGDSRNETDETFTVTLTDPVAATLGTASAMGTILNDDGAPPDTTAPTATTFSPADEATGVAVGSNIMLTFSEAIQRGTGSIVLKTAAGATVATYDAASSANLSISGGTLTLNPTADLTAGTAYTVEFAAGSVKDLAGNNFAGTTSYNFTTAAGTTTPPPNPPTLSKDAQFLVLQPSSPSIVGAGVGDDTYLISGSMIPAGKSITISDASGVNSIQLAQGLSITASQVTSSALKMTLNTGSTVTVLGANAFTYELGGNSSAGLNATDVSYASFVASALGTSIPTTGIATGGSLVVGGGSPATLLASGTAGNDFVIPQYASPSIVGAGAGDDTYLISSALLPAGTALTISDATGSNSIQLAPGLSIASSQVAASALKLTLDTGATVTILGANTFTYDVGGNTTAGIDQADVSFATLVQNTLGTTVPSTGTTNGGAVVIGSASPTGTPVQGNGTVNATAANDVFFFDAVTALLDAAGGNTQAIISGFSTSADKLQINLPTANAAMTTLSQLNGQQRVTAQHDPFTGNMLISFGSDANGGQVVSLTLIGVTDAGLVSLLVV